MAIRLSDLNPPQRQAVITTDGPLLVLAGAGSGKTRVITYRIAHLLERGVRADAICAVSFTNKAAEEMRERVERLCGSGPSRTVTLSTFHSLGLLILKAEVQALGLTGGFTVYDTADQLGVLREILRSANVGKRIDLKTVLSRISRLKNAGVTPESFLNQVKRVRSVNEYDGYTAEIYPRYQQRLRALAAFDFDDLLVETLELLRRDEKVRGRWQTRFRYLMIDEYQDTNRCQLEFLRLLAAAHGNLAVVGDDDQSIYGWRGAESRNILEFATHFPGAQTIKLEENYRSTDVILSAANAVIAKNPLRHEKQLWTQKKGGDLIEVVACPDELSEASFIVEEIDRLVAQRKYQLRDFAVLYRSNKQTGPVEEALRTARIDYRVVGGQAFYDRKEVKDAIAYLKLLVFPHDEISLRRVINYPPRGIGPGTLDRLGAALRRARERRPNVSLWELLLALSQEHQTDLFSGAPPSSQPSTGLADGEDAMGPRVLAALSRFVDIVQRHRAGATGSPVGLAARAEQYLRDMGIHDDLVRAGPTRIQSERRLRNLADFLNGIETYASRSPGTFDLHNYLQRMALSAQDDDANEDLRDEVTLSTLHGAKGLEFRVVFLCGFEEGLLPHKRSIDPRPGDHTLAGGDGEQDDENRPSDIDEERRLCYVGITRAREILYLLFARERTGRMELRSPSRFLEDVPKELTRSRDLEGGGGKVARDAATEEQFAEETLSRLLQLTAES